MMFSLHKDLCAFMIISRCIILIMTYVLGRRCRENQNIHFMFNPLTPNDHYSGRTAPLTSKCCILYIYPTNTGTEYFKHARYFPVFPLQNAVCFIILTYLVPVFSHFIYRVC